MPRFVSALLVFVAGLTLGGAVDCFLLRPLFAALALSAALASWALRARPRLAGASACLALLAAGLALPLHEVPPAVSPPGLYRMELTVDRLAHGTGVPRVEAHVHFGARIDDGAPLAPGARVYLRGPLPSGARVRILARLRPRAAFRNRTPSAAWPRRALSATGRIVGEPEVLTRAAWREVVADLRAAIRTRLVQSLEPGAAGVARALVLGDRQAVDDFRAEVVRGAGLAHVLAVSGLHVAVSVGLLIWLLRGVIARIPFLVRRLPAARLAYAIGAPLSLAYAELAGGAPSARRAALTAALAFGLRAVGRRPSPLPLATMAIALLGATDPDRILDPGLVLSVVATLAVVTTDGPTAPTALSRLRAASRVSLRATLATAPVVWWCFGSVPFVGIIANVVLAPLAAALLIPAALVHTIVVIVSPTLGGITASFFEVVDAAFTGACSLMSLVSLGHDLPPPTLAQGIVASLGALAVVGLGTSRRAIVAAALSLALLFGLELLVRHDEPPDALRITFVDVGQGDSSIVEMPDGTSMVIDGGGGSARPGMRALLPILRARRRSHVDVVVVSHPHPDHYEGLADLARALPVRELWDSGQAAAEDPEGPAAEAIERIEQAGALRLEPPELCSGPRRFGEVEVRMLAPCPRYDPGWDPNDNSLVLSIRYGRRTFLFTGDAEAHEESTLTEAARTLRADVLKVPHHGSRTSSSSALLTAVAPRLSIISAGVHNRYGHPHQEVFARLARAGRVLSTARDGGVVVITNGRTLEVRPFHGPGFAL